MDFLEGALLGPLWSDTDYEERKHKGLRLLLSFCFWLGIAGLIYLLNFRAVSLAFITRIPWLWIFLGLFLVSPFLCKIYYKLPVILRFIILGLQLVKHAAFYLVAYQALVPHLRLNLDELMPTILDFFNDTIGQFIEFYTERYEATGMLISAAILAIIGVIILILIILLIIYLPQIMLLILRQLQLMWDYAVKGIAKLIQRIRRPEGQRERVAVMPQGGQMSAQRQMPARGSMPAGGPTSARGQMPVGAQSPTRGQRPARGQNPARGQRPQGAPLAQRGGQKMPPRQTPQAPQRRQNNAQARQQNRTLEDASVKGQPRQKSALAAQQGPANPAAIPPRDELFKRHEIRRPSIDKNPSSNSSPNSSPEEGAAKSDESSDGFSDET